MALLGIDLGGTKLALALYKNDGSVLARETVPLDNRSGKEVGRLIAENTGKFIALAGKLGDQVSSVGVSVPGISRISTGTVWAPKIAGWDDYPLRNELKQVTGSLPLVIDSDRACYISGELWQGNARGCKDAIFLAVGTGIGAGIIVNGEILRGAHDIAGAIGWLALDRPFDDEYVSCGCFETYASGEGIARQARKLLRQRDDYSGLLKNKNISELTSHDVFDAFTVDDSIATDIIIQCVEFWGMAVANLVSLFNPEKIIFGGGVFGPAVPLIPSIKAEAAKWAQPISITQVAMEPSALAGEAGVCGAGYLALKQLDNTNH